MQRLRLLNRFFFQELGFAGNVNDYYDPKNSYLHCVLQTRRGIPITLALLYVEIAARSAWRDRHLVSRPLPGQAEDAAGRGRDRSVHRPVDVARGARRAAGAVPRPAGLPAARRCRWRLPAGATPREIVARMLRNLKEIHRRADDPARLHAVLQRLVVLLPTPGRSGAIAAWPRRGSAPSSAPSSTSRPISSTCPRPATGSSSPVG